jgi:hypothetical protein
MYSRHRSDQQALVLAGLAGTLERARGATDVLSVVSQNAGANKIDWFLQREIRYRVALDPSAARARGELEIDIVNQAPRSGLPDYVIGSAYPSLEKGTSRQILGVVRSSDELRSLRVADRSVSPSRSQEGRLRAYRWVLDVPPGSSTTVRMSSDVQAAFAGSGRRRTYRLMILPQPVAHADRLAVEIDAPLGWRVWGPTRFEGYLNGDIIMEVELTQTGPGWLYEHLWSRPWKLARQVLDGIF